MCLHTGKTYVTCLALAGAVTVLAPRASAAGEDYSQYYSDPDAPEGTRVDPAAAPDPRSLRKAPDPAGDAAGQGSGGGASGAGAGRDPEVLRQADQANAGAGQSSDGSAGRGLTTKDVSDRMPRVDPPGTDAMRDAAQSMASGGSSGGSGSGGSIPTNSLVSVNKSGVRPQVLKRPKGNGSVKGMGVTFRTNLQTGSASLSVPIALPAGRHGLGPSLALGYSSGGSQGVCGLGWSFGVGFIGRQTDQGLPIYDDDIDHFVYNGGRELVRVQAGGEALPAWADGDHYYRAKIEGLLMRFFRVEDGGGAGSPGGGVYWVAQDKDGTLYYFGGTPEDGALAEALVCGAATGGGGGSTTCAHVFRWNLVLVRDVYGNEVRYGYSKDQGQVYLTDVWWTNHPSGSGYQHHVEVGYESRPDVLTTYQPGFGVTTARRLSEIRVYTDYGGAGGGAVPLPGQPSDSEGRLQVRAYQLRYQAGLLHSILQEVQLYGKDDQTSLPPARFSYQEVDAGGGGAYVPEMGNVAGQVRELGSSPHDSLGDGRRDLLDVDADGLPDVIESDPTNPGPLWKAYLNDGAWLPSSPRGLTSAPPELLSNTNVRLLDLDGDGRTELIHMPHVGWYRIYKMECEEVAPGGSGAERDCGWVQAASVSVNPSIDLTTDAAEIKLVDII